MKSRKKTYVYNEIIEIKKMFNYPTEICDRQRSKSLPLQQGDAADIHRWCTTFRNHVDASDAGCPSRSKVMNFRLRKWTLLINIYRHRHIHLLTVVYTEFLLASFFLLCPSVSMANDIHSSRTRATGENIIQFSLSRLLFLSFRFIVVLLFMEFN